MPAFSSIEDRLPELGLGRLTATLQPVSGGDTAAAYRMTTTAGHFFAKRLAASAIESLQAEADGLKAIAATASIAVPRVAACETVGDHAWLILEWLELERVRTRDSASLGRALAALHEHLGPRFGWHRDNWLGKTRQTNAWCDDWLTFLAEQRIGSQLRLAHDNGFTQLAREGALLLQRLQSLLADHAPAPSLLHGDLWSGNAAISQGQPVVFDPACYYGDRESDLAMTRLFGGFDDAFYAAYEEAAPLPAGHQPRCLIYQLYHLLNHLNLFGGGYLSQCRAVIARLI